MARTRTSQAPRDDSSEMPAREHRRAAVRRARGSPAARSWMRTNGALCRPPWWRRGFHRRVRCADNVSCRSVPGHGSTRKRGNGTAPARRTQRPSSASVQRRHPEGGEHGQREQPPVTAAGCRPKGRPGRRRRPGVGRISATAAATGGEAVPIWLIERRDQHRASGSLNRSPCCVAYREQRRGSPVAADGHNDGQRSQRRYEPLCLLQHGQGADATACPAAAGAGRRPKAARCDGPGRQRPRGAAGATDACTAGTDTAFPATERERAWRSRHRQPSSQAPPGRPARRLTRSSQHGGTAES